MGDQQLHPRGGSTEDIWQVRRVSWAPCRPGCSPTAPLCPGFVCNLSCAPPNSIAPRLSCYDLARSEAILSTQHGSAQHHVRIDTTLVEPFEAQLGSLYVVLGEAEHREGKCCLRLAGYTRY